MPADHNAPTLGTARPVRAAAWDEASARLRGSAAYKQVRAGARVLRRAPVGAAAWIATLLSDDEEHGLLAVVPRESDALAFQEIVQLIAPERHPVVFPARSLSPFQETEASLFGRSQEALALEMLRQAQESGVRPIVVCTAPALLRRLPTQLRQLGVRGEIVVGGEVSPDQLAEDLTRWGYRRTELVAEVGSFAQRGGVFDVYPPGEPLPLRLDFFGDAVESIRRFDPASQRSGEALERARLLPLSVFPSDPDAALELAMVLRRTLSEELDVGGTCGELGQEAEERLGQLESGQGFPGWENYLPLLEERTVSLLELVERASILLVDPEELRQELRRHVELVEMDRKARRSQGRLAVAAQLLVGDLEDLGRRLDSARLVVDTDAQTAIASRTMSGAGGSSPAVDFGATETDRLVGQFPRFPREVEVARARGEHVLLVAPEEHHERLAELLRGRELAVGVGGVELVVGELQRGFRLPAAGVQLFGEPQLFAPRPRAQVTSQRRPFLSSLRDLKVGEFVVHQDHGIGQFVGMRTLAAGAAGPSLPPSLKGMLDERQRAQEVMEIVYSGERTLLLPLSRLGEIQRYSGIEGVRPKLDQLGGTSWNRKKSRVKRSLRKLATDLLKLYAERELAHAPAAGPDSDAQLQFESAFPFEETEDQTEAARAIKQDLEGERPMDRLLVGDVGFGKTEVAMRAAFKMVDSGHQVALLAPTTILADQHLDTFRARFAGFPIEVDMISRFRTTAEIRRIRERVAEGKIDILIGTHRLLNKDIEFRKLGLLVVDEEQRFGVGHKEKLKDLRRNLHVLAMSATPVPRTLQLSLAGVRDLSTIETPPKDRMSVETRILPFDSELVREAIEHELERQGQVYYVYNRVEDIEQVANLLRELCPGLRLTVGHGQLDERELARRMHAFKNGEMDLLLATTIIENGIDIPNVNTMIVHRADRFGLAQLYQLRGRVGRGSQLAYCYLLVPSDRVLPEVARKRLLAIREFTELGAGFRIAARDLEIRGAGNLLGAEQSGHIAEIGIETYLKMLEETVRELRGEATEERPSAQIDLPVDAIIPEEYVAEPNLRMEIYRRFAADDQLPGDVLAELNERFGPPPRPVETLCSLALLKHRAEALRVQSIRTKGRQLVFQMRRDARVDIERLIELVSEHPEATFTPEGVLMLEGVPPQEALEIAGRTLETIAAEPPGQSAPEGVN